MNQRFVTSAIVITPGFFVVGAALAAAYDESWLAGGLLLAVGGLAGVVTRFYWKPRSRKESSRHFDF